MKFYIPTLNRVDSQVTFEGLPDRHKENVIMVVQEHERPLYKYDVEYMVVPTGHGIAKTRRDISYHAGRQVYAVYDDDVTMYYRDPDYKEKGIKSRIKFNDQHWDEWFAFAEESAEEPNMIQIGCKFSHQIPIWSKNPNDPDGPVKEYSDFGLITQAYVLNGNNLMDIIDDIPWTGCELAEDLNFTLACLVRGYKTRISQRFTYHSVQYTDGGCSTYRDAPLMLESHRWLENEYPGIVKIVPKDVNYLEGVKEILRVQWKKAYTQGAQNRVTKLEF